MARFKRNIRAAADASTSPPDELPDSQTIAQVIKAEGNNLYRCALPGKNATRQTGNVTSTVLAELADQFRNTIWIKRGGYVLVELTPAKEIKGRTEGQIVNVVREEKVWRKQKYWPEEFVKPQGHDSEEDEDPNVGKMPPSESESED